MSINSASSPRQNPCDYSLVTISHQISHQDKVTSCLGISSPKNFPKRDNRDVVQSIYVCSIRNLKNSIHDLNNDDLNNKGTIFNVFRKQEYSSTFSDKNSIILTKKAWNILQEGSLFLPRLYLKNALEHCIIPKNREKELVAFWIDLIARFLENTQTRALGSVLLQEQNKIPGVKFLNGEFLKGITSRLMKKGSPWEAVEHVAKRAILEARKNRQYSFLYFFQEMRKLSPTLWKKNYYDVLNLAIEAKLVKFLKHVIRDLVTDENYDKTPHISEVCVWILRKVLSVNDTKFSSKTFHIFNSDVGKYTRCFDFFVYKLYTLGSQIHGLGSQTEVCQRLYLAYPKKTADYFYCELQRLNAWFIEYFRKGDNQICREPVSKQIQLQKGPIRFYRLKFMEFRKIVINAGITPEITYDFYLNPVLFDIFLEKHIPFEKHLSRGDMMLLLKIFSVLRALEFPLVSDYIFSFGPLDERMKVIDSILDKKKVHYPCQNTHPNITQFYKELTDLKKAKKRFSNDPNKVMNWFRRQQLLQNRSYLKQKQVSSKEEVKISKPESQSRKTNRSFRRKKRGGGTNFLQEKKKNTTSPEKKRRTFVIKKRKKINM